MLSATIRKAASKFFGPSRRRPIRNRFRLQSLEGRDVPSSYYGAGPGDNGAGMQESLQQNSANTPADSNHIDSLIKLENHVETSSSLKIEVANSKDAADSGSGKNQTDAGDRTSKGDERSLQISGQFEAKTLTQLKSSYEVDFNAGQDGRSIAINRDFEMTTMTQIKSSIDVDISGRKGDGSITIGSDFEMTTMTQIKSSFDAEIDSGCNGSTKISRDFEMTTQTQLKSSVDVEMQQRHGGGSIQFSSDFEMSTMTQIKSSFDAEIDGQNGGTKLSREFEATTMTQIKSSFDADIHVRHGRERIKIGRQLESTLMTHLKSTTAAETSQNDDQHDHAFLGQGQGSRSAVLSDYFASHSVMNAGSGRDTRATDHHWFGQNRGHNAIDVGAHDSR